MAQRPKLTALSILEIIVSIVICMVPEKRSYSERFPILCMYVTFKEVNPLSIRAGYFKTSLRAEDFNNFKND